MLSNLDASLDYILQDEGGWVLKPSGAAGNFGIGMATLITWRAMQKKPHPSLDDLKNLSVAEAKAIYGSSLYAGHIGFADLPVGLDYAALDAAVNEGSGVGTPEKPGAQRLLSMTEGVTSSAFESDPTRTGALVASG